MIEKYDIVICLGSSCFARGNKKTVQAIETYIKEHNLADKVFFHGGHCFNNCEKGPILMINKKIFENVDHLNVIEILGKEIED
jgi:NADH:ubiquinone oxidoreductase subunit E